MKTYRKTILILSLMATSVNLFAEDENNFEADVNIDVISTYVWRGQKLDDAAAQPSLTVSYRGLSLNAWGSASLVGTGYKEFDLTLAYTIGGFTAQVCDYWCANDNTKYFEYTADSTIHTFEAGVAYNFGKLSIGWYTNFYGAIGTKENGDDAYSSYFEIAAPFKFGGLEWQAALGVTPWENDYYGADDFAIINCSLMATKEFELQKLTLPVFAQITANPKANRLYFTVGVSF